MNKTKTKRKKPYKSMPSNVLWSFRGQLKHSPLALAVLLIGIPINIGLSYALIYLPSLVVAEVTQRQTAAHAAAAVGALMLAILLGSLIKEAFSYLRSGALGVYCFNIAREHNKKSLGCFYQAFESKKMRDLMDRAERTTQMWDGVQPVTDLPRQACALIESVACYFLFGAIVSVVSPWLLLALTAAPVINWLSVRAYQKWEYKHRENWSSLGGKLWYTQSRAGDFESAKDIRIYGMADWLKQVYKTLCDARTKWNKKLTARDFLSRLADLVIILIRDSAAYAILITMTLKNEITIDKFVIYFAAISSFAGWIGGIINGWNALNGASLSICDLREYLEYPDIDGTGEANIEDFMSSAPEIVFTNVCFRYEGAGEDTLHNINLTIHKGEKIALVGLNGAGKTTFVKLLCGLYAPASGEISVNGVAVNKFHRDDYYKLFSPVFQDVKTAFFSLAETVSCASIGDTDMARAEDCMRRAGLGEKIDALPKGILSRLDKQVNKDGIELSGGEVQKLMLARALYKDAPMLVLDEPTAALDPIAENNIYLSYNQMAKQKTSLFISHRLVSTRFCDRILLLENGQITEDGTHDELMASGREYARLYDMQSCWYVDTEGAKV